MEVQQSLNETMRLFDESVDELFLLLTNFYVMVAMDTVVNKWKSLIGQNEGVFEFKTWLESYIQQMNCWILWISRVSEAWNEVRQSEVIPG